MQKRKEFTVTEENGKEVKLAIKPPQYEDLENGEKVYAAKVSWLVKESGGKRLLLRSQLDDFLRQAGVWTVEDEKTVGKTQSEIDALLNQLRKGGLKLSEGREIAIKIMDKRKDIVRTMSKRQIFDDTTIESIAENEKTDYLIYACTCYSETGDRYWASFEDMKNDKLNGVYQQASVAAYDLIYGVNPEFEKRLPENKWLKKYNFVDENLNYTDRKTGERVDRDGKPIAELEKTLQKQVENLQGDIEAETPFIDDETGEVVEPKKEEKTDTLVAATA